MKHYDILIVGAGIVGNSLAYALRNTQLSIGLIEASSVPTMIDSDYDQRNIGLAYGSAQFLQQMGLWQPLSDYSTPITSVHVSEAGRFGVIRLDCKQLQLPALGYVVPNKILMESTETQLATIPRIDVIRPGHITQWVEQADHLQVDYQINQQEKQCTCQLLIGADGADSHVRQLAGITCKVTDYQQSAMVANISTELAHQNIAYERFFTTGPIALLPISNNRYGLVWVMSPEDAKLALSWSEQAFLQALQQSLGYRFGRLERVGRRQTFPLQLQQPEAIIKSRIALIGNAAHTLHPIAAQGLNLGLRDVADFYQLLAMQSGSVDLGSTEFLQQYAQKRQQDQWRTTHFTHGLVNLFGIQASPVKCARNAGMLLFDHLSTSKQIFAKYAMGL